MTRPVYEHCLNLACQREQACQSETFCIGVEKNIWNEAIEAALAARPETPDDPLIHSVYRVGWASGVKDKCEAIRALKRQ